MYKIVLFDSSSNETTILDYSKPDVAFLGSPKIMTGVSFDIPTFDFSINQSNPGYDNLHVATTRVEVFDILAEKSIFIGRVASVDESMDENGLNTKEVSCEGEIAYLCDTVIYNKVCFSGDLNNLALQQIIAKHNEQADANGQFAVGDIELAGIPERVDFLDGSNTTYDVIKTIFEEKLKGEIRIRHANGKRYIDFTLTTFGEEVEQALKTRVNIKSMARKYEISEVFSRMIPLSGEPESGLARLTMLPYTSTLPSDYAVSNKVYLENKELYDAYGPIYKCVVFDNIKVTDDDADPNHVGIAYQLYQAGLDWMNDYVFETESFEISALDLSFVDESFDRFEAGNTYKILNPFLSILTKIRLIKVELELNTPYAPTLTFGSKDIKLTDVVAKSK